MSRVGRIDAGIGVVDLNAIGVEHSDLAKARLEGLAEEKLDLGGRAVEFGVGFGDGAQECGVSKDWQGESQREGKAERDGDDSIFHSEVVHRKDAKVAKVFIKLLAYFASLR